MKPTLFLRIASALTLVHAVLHTVGGIFGKPAPGVAAATDALMRANYFQVLGVTRNYWQFYRGMGLGVTIFLTTEGLIFWLLASLVKKHADVARDLRPILWVFALAYLVFAVNSCVYFFAAPVIVETLIAACLLAATLTPRPAPAT